MYGFSSEFSPNLRSLYWKTTDWHSRWKETYPYRKWLQTQEITRKLSCAFQTLPLPRIALLLLAVTMVISVYSYKKIKADAEPDKRIKTFWAVVFILFPIALIFSEESMYRLQSVSIIAAFPIGIVIVLIIISFLKMHIESCTKSE